MTPAVDPARDRLIMALDVDTVDRADALVSVLAPHVGAFKIGFELFTAGGAKIVHRIREAGSGVFLDMKFLDIPNTVSRAALVAARLGVTMLNVHATGGSEMMKRVVEVLEEASEKEGMTKPILLAVTVLTSMDDEDLMEVGFKRGVTSQVVELAKLAKTSGLDGVVCSAREARGIKNLCGESFVTVTPGIRPTGGDVHDQKRILTAAEAVRGGADYLVVGRPISEADDPAGAARAVCNEIRQALS